MNEHLRERDRREGELRIAIDAGNRADRLSAAREGVVKALEELVDPDPCGQFDHHGYCQAHGWLSNPCGHAGARAALKELEASQ